MGIDFLVVLGDINSRASPRFLSLIRCLRGQVARSHSLLGVVVTGARVLIVEDDEAARAPLQAAFAIEGFIVQSALDGQQALRLVKVETPDLIVLDLMLPWVNGIQVLATVRQNPRLSSVPVIVTTGTATSAFDLRDYGPVYVAHKPLDTDVLVQVAQKLLDMARQ